MIPTLVCAGGSRLGSRGDTAREYYRRSRRRQPMWIAYLSLLRPPRATTVCYLARAADPHRAAVPVRVKVRRIAAIVAMHWGFGYLGKHATQKVLGAVPSGFRAQEWWARATRRHDRVSRRGLHSAKLRTKIARLNRAGIGPPERSSSRAPAGSGSISSSSSCGSAARHHLRHDAVAAHGPAAAQRRDSQYGGRQCEALARHGSGGG